MVNRSLRLREERDIRETRAKGKAYADGPIVVRILARPGEPPRNRYTVIAGKRIGKAHERNRCKRLLREAIRGFHPGIKRGFDIAIMLRGGIAELPDLEVARSALERVYRRANLFLPPTPAGEPPAELPEHPPKSDST